LDEPGYNVNGNHNSLHDCNSIPTCFRRDFRVIGGLVQTLGDRLLGVLPEYAVQAKYPRGDAESEVNGQSNCEARNHGTVFDQRTNETGERRIQKVALMMKARSLPEHCKRTEDGEHARVDPESNFISLFHGVYPYRASATCWVCR
jgi:hypothetical protein